MSFIGDMFSSSKGAGFQAGAANIENPTNMAQVNTAYDQTQKGLQQQQALIQALQAQNGIQNQAGVFQQQQGLANQLQDSANGLGPNPALAQFQQATGQNVANQAALMAGQRGAGANVGLIARQAGQQGAGIQQNAAGQAAVMQAQQQLAARQQLQQQQSMMAGLSTQQVGQEAGAVGGYNQAAQSQQQNLLNAMGGFNQSNVAMQSNMNSANAGIAAQNAKSQAGMLGGVLNAAGGALGLGANQGANGATQSYFGASGGMVPDGGPMSAFGKHAASYKSGGMVPGSAPVGGDSLQNDVVPAMLSPKEIVLPRSVTMSDDPARKAAEFVAAIMARKKPGSK